MKQAEAAADWMASLDLAGWRGRAAAFVAGGLSILSMAPFFLWPILWLTLPALLLLMWRAEIEPPPERIRFARWRAQAIGRAAETGWWFGFAYHIFGLFWIVEAFLVEAAVFAWLIPFTLLLPAGLALFTAGATAFAAWVASPIVKAQVPSPLVGEGGGDHRRWSTNTGAGAATDGSPPLPIPPPQGGREPPSLQGRIGFDRVVALAVGVGVAEWLRGHIFTGLPWNVLGYALTPPGMMQGAAYVGIYGLTVVAVLVFAGAPHMLGVGRIKRAVVSLVVVPALLWFVSWSDRAAYDRMRNNPNRQVSIEGPLRVRIVQPSIVQREKWLPENQRRIFDAHLELSTTNAAGQQDGAAGITLIVWPEAAMPFVPLSQPVALAEIGRMLPPRATLLAGAIRVDPATPQQPRRVYNTLLGFQRGEPATHVATYDKTHLVPFGEYLPFARVLEGIGLRGLAAERGGFASGPEPRALIDIPGIGKIAPLICYEAIFPTRVVQSKERPRALVMVTNDGWFGNTTGPRQHFHMARVRAVEEGVPVIRSANNGISGLIDPMGRVVASLALDVRGTIDASLPPSALSPPLYARVGDVPFACLVLFLAGWLGLRYQQRRVNESFRNEH